MGRVEGGLSAKFTNCSQKTERTHGWIGVAEQACGHLRRQVCLNNRKRARLSAGCASDTVIALTFCNASFVQLYKVSGPKGLRREELVFRLYGNCGAIIINISSLFFFFSFPECSLSRDPPLPQFPWGGWSSGEGRLDWWCLAGTMRSCSALHTSLVSPICSLALYFTITSRSIAPRPHLSPQSHGELDLPQGRPAKGKCERVFPNSGRPPTARALAILQLSPSRPSPFSFSRLPFAVRLMSKVCSALQQQHFEPFTLLLQPKHSAAQKEQIKASYSLLLTCCMKYGKNISKYVGTQIQRRAEKVQEEHAREFSRRSCIRIWKRQTSRCLNKKQQVHTHTHTHTC